MARRKSGVRTENGTSEGPQDSITSAPGTTGDEQTLSEHDQTLADTDQTSADSDHTSADGDQFLADSDQAASDRDQAASDRDLQQGGHLGLHEVSRDLRDRSTQQRRETAQDRARAAAARDAVAEARDVAAAARDRVAALRDRQLAKLDAAWADGGTGGAGESADDRRHRDAAERADEGRRSRAAADRAAAAEGRVRAAADRERAARDREQASRDRAQAQADRDALLHQLAIAETDDLTGARSRSAGLTDLEHEIDRARRAIETSKLTVVYVDIVGLKAVNDTRGHTAGDTLLRHVVGTIRAHLRSFDLIVRLGGDEFLCAMSGATIESARSRFDTIKAALAADADRSGIKVGFATLMPGDTSEELIKRADAQLPMSRPT